MKKNIDHSNITHYLDSTIKIVAFTAILYFIIGKTSLLIFLPKSNILPYFPAIGFAISVTLLFGRKALPGVAIGCLLFSLSLYQNDFLSATTFEEFSKPLALTLIRPIMFCINASLVSYFTKLWCKKNYPFDSEKNVIYFAIACLLGTFLSISIGIASLAIISYFTIDECFLIWGTMLRGNIMGAILFTPFAHSWLYPTNELTGWSTKKKIEATLLIISTIAITIFIFETHISNESVLFFLLIWAAIRFGLKIITLVITIITIIAIYCTAHHMGGFAFDSWNNNFFLLQLFLFVNMVSILYFKAILIEKESEQNKLKISEQVLSTERNILKATIESTNNTRIYSLDTNFNYLNFNSAHEKFMQNIHNASIKIGDNHLKIISGQNDSCEYISQYQNVLEGNPFLKEEKDSASSYWKIAKSPIRDNDNNIIGISVMITDISDLKLKELQLKENNFSLNERVKELSCLFTVTKILNRKSLSNFEKLQACAQVIPTSLQFPEKANCSIQFLDQEFFSANYDKNNVHISQKIVIKGQESGYVEVGYFDHKKTNEKEVFLEEEVKLLETLSHIISKSLQTNITEENLRKSEKTYRTLFENVQDVFFKSSIQTKIILDVSPSCSQFNGITRKELIGQHIFSIYSDESEGQLILDKLFKEKKITDYNSKITIKDKDFYISINAEISFDDHDEPEFIMGSIRDISNRRLAEENLKISEEKFRSIYENMQDVYYLHTLGGILLDVSPSVEKHLQQTRENLIGTYIPNFYNEPTKYEELKSKIEIEGFLNDEEVEFLTPSGETIFFSINSRLINDSKGESTLVEGTMRNINERIMNQKQILEATEKIKESEAKFRAIYETFEDVYFKKTYDGLLLDVSPSVEKYFNMKREDVIGMNAYDFYVDPAEGVQFYEALVKNRQIHDYEVRLKTGDDKISYFSVSAKVTNDCKGHPAYFEGTMRDITERIQDREKLLEGADKIKKSEEKFRSIFENMQDIFYQHHFDGTIIDMSPSCEKHFNRKREEMIGSNTIDLYYDPSRQGDLRKMIIKDGFINDEHVQFINANGESIFFSVNCKMIYDHDGVPSHVEGSLRNINDRILSQKQLLEANEKIIESEKKYRNIFENARDVFYMGSAKENIITDISPSCSYFGVQPEDLIGKSIKEFYFEPNDRVEVLETLMKYGELKDYVVKFVFNGKPYYVSLNSKITYDQNNEPELLFGSFTDVTDRIKAEENLKLSEAKFRAIYESFDDVYFKTKIDGTITEISPSFEKYLGIPCGEALGSSVLDLYYNKKEREFLLKKLKTDSFISDFDAQFKDINGNPLFFSINAHLLHQDGVPTHIEGTLRNINDRIAVQKEMLSKNRKLEFQNTELEQFAYIASHDLQEPLITVIHSIQMLEEELGEKLDQDQKQYLEFINSSTSRMQVLVKGLLDYSRIGKERRSSKIDCNEIIALVLADMDSSLKESKAIVEYENLPVIESNATEMRQLFQNLISNANKFRKKGIQPKIKISAVKEGNNWLFSIEDNGIGIEEHNMDKVFVIFKRLHNRDEYQGTGIGLSHCKKIIEQHRGKIWVESIYNEGSTFKWTLPNEQNY